MNIIERLLSLVFPYSGDVEHALSMPLDALYTSIAPHIIEDAIAISLYSYRDPLVRALVYATKFEGSNEGARRIALLMKEALPELLFEKLLFDNLDAPLVLPVPLGKERMSERGFNQAERIAKNLAVLLPSLNNIRTDVLIRTRDTKKQSHIRDASGRAKNVRDAFFVNNPDIVKGKHIILIDDVISTGSTLSECARVLKNAGAHSILAITFAR